MWRPDGKPPSASEWASRLEREGAVGAAPPQSQERLAFHFPSWLPALQASSRIPQKSSERGLSEATCLPSSGCLPPAPPAGPGRASPSLTGRPRLGRQAGMGSWGRAFQGGHRAPWGGQLWWDSRQEQQLRPPVTASSFSASLSLSTSTLPAPQCCDNCTCRPSMPHIFCLSFPHSPSREPCCQNRGLTLLVPSQCRTPPWWAPPSPGSHTRQQVAQILRTLPLPAHVRHFDSRLWPSCGLDRHLGE